MPATGSTSAVICSAVAAALTPLPSLSAAENLSASTPSESYAVATTRGALSTISTSAASITGISTTMYVVTATRTQGLSSATLASGSRPGIRLARIGRMRLRMSGHAREVGDDVVAVQAQQRHQLLEDREVLQDDDQQQRLEARRRVQARRREREDRVEVDAAEVRAQAARLVQAVGVGDVAVEDRPHDVDAGAEHAGLARRRRRRRSRGRTRERPSRRRSRRRRRAAATAGRPPRGHPRRCRGCRRPRRRGRGSAATSTSTTGGRKSGLKSVVRTFVKRSGTSAVRNFSASSWSGFSMSGLEPSASASTPSGRSLRLDEELDVAGADLAAERRADATGDLGVVARAVALLGDEVQ